MYYTIMIKVAITDDQGNDIIEEYQEWLYKKNVDYTSHWSQFPTGEQCYAFVFANEKDAMHFRLVWG